MASPAWLEWHRLSFRHLQGWQRIHAGRQLQRVGAHCKGHNANSIGVCYIGGLSKDGKPKDTRTAAQKKALMELVSKLRQEYPLATVHGHNEFAAKACPCFDVGTTFEI